MGNLEKELKQIIKKNVYNMSYFINKKSNNKFWGKKNRKELIKLLPIIIENTNESNKGWLIYNKINEPLFKEKEFLEALIKNIDKIKTNSILLSCINIFDNLSINEKQTEMIINNILKCKFNLKYQVIEELYFLIKRNCPNKVLTMWSKYIRDERVSEISMNIMISKNKDIELIENNIDFILENIDNIDLFSLKKICKSDIINEKLKEKIEISPKKSLLITLENLSYKIMVIECFKDERSNKKLKDILEVIYLIIEDICKNEKLNFKDINLLSQGAFSYVIELGNKVLKIGDTRGTKKFPNNPYINSILLRKEFYITKNHSLFVEVNEKLDTKSEITEEELYQLYKKLRDIKLIWADIAVRNVGKLLKDNQNYWREELPITDERIGLETYRGKEKLQKGNIVVLDNDLIFDENTDFSEIRKYGSPLLVPFEERYQREKRINNTTIIQNEEEKNKRRK